MKMLSKVVMIAAVSLSLALAGCSATYTAIKKRNLDVQTKMSDTVFLDPVKASKQVVYLQIRNTSDKQDIHIKAKIKEAIEGKGYRITNDLDKAHYLIQANILQVSKTDQRDSQAALVSSYGSGLIGAAAGASLAGGGAGRVGTGIIGGLVGMAADAMVEDTYFTMITDVQISVRAPKGVKVTEQDQARLHQGTSGSKQVYSTSESAWKRYQTRIVSVANKVNLDFPTAIPELQKGLVNSIAGML